MVLISVPFQDSAAEDSPRTNCLQTRLNMLFCDRVQDKCFISEGYRFYQETSIADFCRLYKDMLAASAVLPEG